MLGTSVHELTSSMCFGVGSQILRGNRNDGRWTRAATAAGATATLMCLADLNGQQQSRSSRPLDHDDAGDSLSLVAPIRQDQQRCCKRLIAVASTIIAVALHRHQASFVLWVCLVCPACVVCSVDRLVSCLVAASAFVPWMPTSLVCACVRVCSVS